MLQGLAISYSGLQHAQQRLLSVAHNTANAAVAETVPLRAVGRELPGVGVETRVEIAHRAQRVGDAVDLISVSKNFAAGIRAVQSQDAMVGSLLDLAG